VKQPVGCEVRILVGESPAVAACSLTKVMCARFELAVATTVFAGGEEERYFAPMNDAQGGGRCRGSEFQGRGRSPEIQGTWRNRAPSRLFSLVPRRALKRWVWPVVKTTVTSPQEREMQVRILPREYARVAELAKAPNVPWLLIPRPKKLSAGNLPTKTPA